MRSAQSCRTLVRLINESGVAPLRGLLPAKAPVLPLVPLRGDYDLNPHLAPPAPRELVPAAVLVPIIRRADPAVLFTQRTDRLVRHAGQVSFPGGRLHGDDLSLVATALRETEEETGIEARFVSVAGFLDPYETVSGFAILPVVGIVDEGFSLQPNEDEVAEIFEVPLAFLLDETNCGRHQKRLRGQTREFYAFSWGGQYIWGATAAIIVDLRERLCA